MRQNFKWSSLSGSEGEVGGVPLRIIRNHLDLELALHHRSKVRFAPRVQVLGCGSGSAILPRFEVGERGPDTATTADRGLEGGLLRNGSVRDEEFGQFLGLRRQELHGLEAGLEALGEQVQFAVAGAQERTARAAGERRALLNRVRSSNASESG